MSITTLSAPARTDGRLSKRAKQAIIGLTAAFVIAMALMYLFQWLSHEEYWRWYR